MRPSSVQQAAEVDTRYVTASSQRTTSAAGSSPIARTSPSSSLTCTSAPVLSLPREIIFAIIGLLTVKDLASLRMINRDFNCMTNRQFWKEWENVAQQAKDRNDASLAENVLQGPLQRLQTHLIDEVLLVRDQDGRTVGSYAASRGHCDTLSLYLKVGGVETLLQSDNKHQTMLWHAVNSGQASTAKHLLQHASTVRLTRGKKSAFLDTCPPPLSAAVAAGNHSMVQLLLQNGARCHTFDKKGWLPIHYAAKGNHLLIAECILKKAGCTWSAFDRSKSLLLAAEHADEGMLRLLIDHNASVDSRGVFEETALMETVKRGHWLATKVLLDKGAQVELKNCFGRTALFYAAAAGHTQIVQLLIRKDALLISKGAQIKSEDGQSPFSIAVKNDHIEMIQLFLQHDASLRSHPACPAEMMERDRLGDKHKRRRLR